MISLDSFSDEIVKIADAKTTVAKKAPSLLAKLGPKAALVGTGALGYHFGKQGLQDWKLGRQYRKAMERQRR